VPVAKAEVEAARLGIEVKVRRAYAQLAATQARAALADDTIALATTLSRMTRAKVGAGTASDFEAEQADLARRRAEQDGKDAEARVGEAQVGLGVLLGDGTPETLAATDPLWPLPDAPAEDVLARGLAVHPAVATDLEQQHAALARAHSERMSLLPTPVLSLEVQRFPDPATPVGLRDGVTFDLPLLSWNGGAVAQEEATAARAKASADAKGRALAAQVAQARRRFDVAARRARFFHDELLPAAHHVVTLAQTAYQLGRTPLSNVLQAQADLVKADADAIDAQQAVWDAMADLEESSGARF